MIPAWRLSQVCHVRLGSGLAPASDTHRQKRCGLTHLFPPQRGGIVSRTHASATPRLHTATNRDCLIGVICMYDSNSVRPKFSACFPDKNKRGATAVNTSLPSGLDSQQKAYNTPSSAEAYLPVTAAVSLNVSVFVDLIPPSSVRAQKTTCPWVNEKKCLKNATRRVGNSK